MKRTDDVQHATDFSIFASRVVQGLQGVSAGDGFRGWGRRVARCELLALFRGYLRIGGAVLGATVAVACTQMNPAAEGRVAAAPASIESPGRGGLVDPTRIAKTREYFAASGRRCIEFEKVDDAGDRRSARACQRDGQWIELRPFAP